MNPDHLFAEVEALFHRAMDVPEQERLLLIDQCSEGNPALRKEVLSLVDAVSAADRLRTHPADEASRKNAAAAETMAGERLGAFQLDRLLGRGGLGEVYAAHRAEGGLEQAVAVKIIGARLDSPVLRGIFFHERDALARLHHPHIARLLDGGLAPNDAPYLVMELVGDEASPAARLDEFVERRGVSLRGRVALLVDVCDAVAYAHHKLIVHGDLKPGNVLVEANGTVKLLDFGAARLLGKDETGSNPPAFTPGYASPEQMQGKPIGVSSDVYSMGKMLERALNGKQDRELEGVIAKATQADAADRYATVEQLAGELRAWLNLLPLSVYSHDGRYRARKWIRRNRLAVAAAAIVLLTLAACIFFTQRSARKALAERDRAVRSAEAVEALAHRLLFDFQEQLKDLGSSTDAQHQLATTTLTYLNQLALDPSLASDALRLDMANAYTRMGNLLGNPYDENLGKPKEAIGALQRAVATASDLVVKAPTSKDARFTLAMAQRSLAEVEFGVGDAQSSLHAMTESATNFQLLAQARDATPGQLMEAASTLGSLGDVYGMPEAASLDDIHNAIECYEQQIALSQRALQIDPANVRARRSVAIGEYKNATLIVDHKPVEAIEGYRQALGELNGLPQQALSAAPTLRLLYLIEAHLGRAYASQGKRAEAVAATLHARDEAAAIVARDPLDDRARFDLATTDKTLGDHMVSANDRKGAMQAYRQALDTFDFILRRDPGKAVVQQHRQEVEAILERGAISSKAHSPVSR